MNERTEVFKKLCDFLSEVKRTISKGRFQLVNRHVNIKAITEYGLTEEDVKSEIKHLTVADYYRGPAPDHKFPNQLVWEFGIMISGQIWYVKLTMTDSENGPVVRCLSFHPADRPMKFPFRE